MANEQSDRIDEIRARLSEIAQERSELLKQLGVLAAESGQQRFAPVVDLVPDSVADKIRLFRRRFVARMDVYPKFWENRAKGTKGYFPVCEAVYEDGVRLRPSELYQQFGSSRFEQLDDRVIEGHLRGRHVVGSYAIRRDDSCIFLACDFDGDGWRECVSAYVDAAEARGIRVLVEISRSGNGGHAWIFFAEPIAARLARLLGALLLAEASSQISKLDLKAYDRFFPNQDTLPKGGFGNLIGLPLQKERRLDGCTVFVDANFEPFADQWSALASTPAYWGPQVRSALELGLEICPIEEASPEELDEVCLSKSLEAFAPAGSPLCDVEADISESLRIPIRELPDEFVAKLLKLATIPNPIFFEKQRMRFPVFEIPRYIVRAELREECVVLPRGCLEGAIDLFAKRGSRLSVQDLRLSERRIRIKFTGVLNREQTVAVSRMNEHDCGVLVAPPGSGKTVMACSLIGKWKLSTIILVNRRAIADQWKDRLLEFTSLDKDQVGVFHGAKKNLQFKVDIVMMQSLAKRDDIELLFRNYSALIVDECHHVPAVTFESIMNHCGARRVLGLTATPRRKDGLEKLLFQQCGPIRHVVMAEADPNLRRVGYLVETSFRSELGESGYVPLHEIWEELVSSEVRNELIASLIIEKIQENRRIVVLSDRRQHLERLIEIVKARALSTDCALESLVGGLGKREFNERYSRIRNALDKGEAVCIFATGSFLGEGFDMKELDTLFLAMPLSFKGRLIQYAGRLHRKFEGKKEVQVFDFLDTQLPVAMSMYRKRKVAYREMGYELKPQKGSY